MFPLETIPPGDPSVGVVYRRTVLSPEQASRMWVFLNKVFFLQGGVVSTSPNPPSWRTTLRRLSATAYSIYSQLPCLSEAVPLSATWGRAMPWWQGHYWIGPAQDRDRWRTLVSTVMNLRVPWNTGNFLTSCKSVSFSRTLHRGVSKYCTCNVTHSGLVLCPVCFTPFCFNALVNLHHLLICSLPFSV